MYVSIIVIVLRLIGKLYSALNKGTVEHVWSMRTRAALLMTGALGRRSQLRKLESVTFVDKPSLSNPGAIRTNACSVLVATCVKGG